MNMICNRAARRWVVAVSLLIPSAGVANKLANPDFEDPPAGGGDVQFGTDDYGWNTFGDPTIKYVTRQYSAHAGVQSLKMFGPWFDGGGTGAIQVFPAGPGEVWHARVWSNNDSRDPMGAGNFCVMKVEFLENQSFPVEIEHGVLVGGAVGVDFNLFEVRVADENAPRDEWREFEIITNPAPEGTRWARIALIEVQLDPIDGGSVFLDDAFFDLYMPPDPCAAHTPVFDTNDDQKVDSADLDAFNACATGPAIPFAEGASQECRCMDRNGDLSVDQQDFAVFQRCYTGSGGTLDAACDD